MRKLLALAPIAIAIVGCSAEEVPATAAATGAAPGSGSPKVGSTVNGTKIVNKPPTDGIPSGGIMLQPDNPNDPHFKPDPRLNGGG